MINTLEAKASGLRKGAFMLMALGILTALLMIPSLAQAWMDWDGTDPVIQFTGGQTLAIRIEWPREFTCSINGPIEVNVKAPAKLNASLVSESTGTFPCQTVSTNITTETDLDTAPGKGNAVRVQVEVKSEDDFPVNVYLTLDGGNAKKLTGKSNSEIRGAVAVR